MNHRHPAKAAAQDDASAIGEILALEQTQTFAQNLIAWAQNTLFTFDVAIQLGLIAGALVPAVLFGPQLKKLIKDHLAARAPYGLLRRAANAFAILATALALYLSLTLFRIALGSVDQPTALIDASISVMSAWIIVRLVTLVIQSDFWSRVAFYIVWPIAALDVFGYLDNVIDQMQALAIPLGQNKAGEPINISLFDVIRTLIYFGLLFWGASFIGRIMESQIQRIDELNPSIKALIIKILNIVLPVLAFLIALQIVGFNLATLAIFSGAVGLGVGLGLQRIVGNFIAGFTLIADRSIKPDDVIEIDRTFGWVTAMEGRYVAMRTRDGTEHLIPNERFMTEGVINWSRSDRVIRLHAPFSVSYKTKDLRLVQDLAIDAAKSVGRVVVSPSPVCNVMAFGDSSVDFDLRFWIADPAKGMANVRSDVYLALWDRLHENQIEIPFPQRDLHVKAWPKSGATGNSTRNDGTD